MRDIVRKTAPPFNLFVKEEGVCTRLSQWKINVEDLWNLIEQNDSWCLDDENDCLNLLEQVLQLADRE